MVQHMVAVANVEPTRTPAGVRIGKERIDEVVSSNRMVLWYTSIRQFESCRAANVRRRCCCT
jgi:hypothetical protein